MEASGSAQVSTIQESVIEEHEATDIQSLRMRFGQYKQGT